jgi:hypothetical protein
MPTWNPAGFGALSAAQQTKCAPKFSFFPKGGEDRNVPHAWGKTAQMAAGNYRDDTMFNIVLTSSNNLPGIIAAAVPMLHVTPVHPLLVMGSTNLPASCTGFVAQPTTPDIFLHKGAAAGTAPAAAAEDTPTAETATDIAESARVAGPADAAVAVAVAAAEAAAPAAAPAVVAAPVASAEASAPAAEANGTAATAATAAVIATAARQLLSSSSSSSSSSSEDTLKWAGDWQEDAAVQAGRHLLGGEAVTTPAMYRLSYSLNGSTPVDTGDVSIMTPVQRITLTGLRAYPDVSASQQQQQQHEQVQQQQQEGSRRD